MHDTHKVLKSRNSKIGAIFVFYIFGFIPWSDLFDLRCADELSKSETAAVHRLIVCYAH